MLLTVSKKNNILILITTSLVVLIGACNAPEKTKNDGVDNVSEEYEESPLDHNVSEAKKIFYMLPSPIETAALLKKAGAHYDKDVLNPIENVSKYELAKSKAINLGVYGADLGLASVFDQSQEAMFFISNCKKLADGLGITEAFDQQTLERLEANINDKDSLLHLISETYWITDNYLQSNERSNLSALIMCGGWVEGLYIAVRLQENTGGELLKKRIAEQKYSLNHLLEIVTAYKDAPGMKEVYDELLDLYNIFTQIKLVESEQSEKTNVIGTKKELQITKEQLEAINASVTKIRNNYINS